jgi:AhpD family alkylhydroperoxidase
MTQKTSIPRDQLGCVVPLIESDEAPIEVRRAFEADEQREGRVRNLTRVVAASPATWQTAARALHMFVTLKRVDARTCALLCLYTSVLNGCRYCIDDAAGAAFDNGVTLKEMLALPDFSTSILGDRLVATLRFVERVALSPTEVPDEVIAAFRAHVDDDELLEITAVVAMKGFWNHFASALRIPPEGRCRDADAFRSLCDLSDAVRRRIPVR